MIEAPNELPAILEASRGLDPRTCALRVRRIASRRTRHQLLPFQKPHNSWDLPNTLPDELVPVAWRFSRSSTIETLKTTFEPAAGGGAMFEQFTERARRVIILAQEEAKRLFELAQRDADTRWQFYAHLAGHKPAGNGSAPAAPAPTSAEST